MDTYPVEHRRPLGSEPRPECIPRLFQPKVIVKVAPTRPRYSGVPCSESDQGGPFRLYGGCTPVAKLGQPVLRQNVCPCRSMDAGPLRADGRGDRQGVAERTDHVEDHAGVSMNRHVISSVVRLRISFGGRVVNIQPTDFDFDLIGTHVADIDVRFTGQQNSESVLDGDPRRYK
jgi:hypothetical protein